MFSFFLAILALTVLTSAVAVSANGPLVDYDRKGSITVYTECEVPLVCIKVADIGMATNLGAKGLAYGFEDMELPNLLGLSVGDAVDVKDGYPCFDGSVLNSALIERMASNPVETCEAISQFTEKNGQTAGISSNESGFVVFSDMELGLYLVAELTAPTERMMLPFFVSIPTTSNTGDSWLYDAEVSPKSRDLVPTLEKKVTNITKGGTDSHIAYAGIGDTLRFTVVSSVPSINPETNGFTQLSYADMKDDGLDYLDTKVSVRLTGSDKATESVWIEGQNTDMMSVHRTDTQLLISFTPAGLEAISRCGDGTLSIEYECSLNRDASIGKEGNDNEVALTWARGTMTNARTLNSCCHVYSYAIELSKSFEPDGGDFSQVSFVLKDRSTELFAQTEKTETGEVVCGWTSDKTQASPLVPSKNGSVVIKGLGLGIYEVEEIRTAEGYILPCKPIEVVLASEDGNEFCVECITKKPVLTATTDGIDTEIKDGSTVFISVTNEKADTKPPVEESGSSEDATPPTGDKGIVLSVVFAVVAAIAGVLAWVGFKRRSK